VNKRPELRARDNKVLDLLKAILASLSPEAQRAAQDEAQNWLQHFRRVNPANDLRAPGDLGV